MKIDFTFEELCQARQEYGDKKYRVWVCETCDAVLTRKPYDSAGRFSDEAHADPITGQVCFGYLEAVNSNIYRNTIFDIVEEIGDAGNEIDQALAHKRLTMAEQGIVGLLKVVLDGFGPVLLEMAAKYDDEIPVERVLPKAKE